MDEPTEIDLVKLAEMHDALHTMIGWYYEVPLDVRKRWVGMPGVVQGFIDTFGPWIESAPDDPNRIEPAMRAVGMDPDDDVVDEVVLRARVKRERDRGDHMADAWHRTRESLYAAESRATELEEALRRAVVILDNLGYKASLPEARALLSLPVPPKGDEP